MGANYEDGQIVLLDGRLVSADGAATVRNERYVLSGSRLCRLPGHMESIHVAVYLGGGLLSSPWAYGERREACEPWGPRVFV